MSTIANMPWWGKERGEDGPHREIFALAGELKSKNATLMQNTHRLMAIYQYGYNASAGVTGVPNDVPIDDETLTFNVAQNVSDTMRSKLIKPKVVPMPLTSGRGYLARHRAKQLGKAIEGEWEENQVDRIKEDVIGDALNTDHGAGAIYVYGCNGKVKAEHAPIDDFFVDDAEARFGTPRCLYRRWRIDRFVALELYVKKPRRKKDGDEDDGDEAADGADGYLFGTPEKRRYALEHAPEASADGGVASSPHMIELWEVWHLPSGPDAEDGRHTIACANETLVDEEYERDHFPIAFYVPRRRMRHMWGLSLMRFLAAPQREYEKVSSRMQRAYHRMGGFHWYAQRGANVDVRELDNGQGTAVEGDTATPPVPMPPMVASPEVAQYREGIGRDMAIRSGLGEMSTTAAVPAGLSQASGKALQVFEDSESERLLPYHRELERWTVQVAWLIVEAARDLAEYGYKTRYIGKKGIESVDWAKVLIDREEMTIKVFPVSDLSKTPSARFEQLTELLNAGAITVEQFKRLFGFPDLEDELALDTADADLVDKYLDMIVVEGRYKPPTGNLDPDLAIARGSKFYNLMDLEGGVPEERMRKLLDWIDDCRALKAKAANGNAAPGGMPGAPMGGPPPGMPPPPPGTPGAPDVPGIPPMPDQPMMPPVAA